MTAEPTRRRVLAALGAGAAGTAGCITFPDESRTSADGALELDGVWPSFGVDARNTGRAATTAPTDPVVDWEFDTTGAIYDGIAVADGTVYVGSTDGTLYAVDADSGEERWRFPVRGQVRTTPTVAGDLVFVGGRNGGLYAIEAESGDRQWEALTGVEFSLSHPTVVDGTVYAGGGDGTLYAVDAASGAQEWGYGLGGDVASSPAVADGTVYVATENTLVALRDG